MYPVLVDLKVSTGCRLRVILHTHWLPPDKLAAAEAYLAGLTLDRPPTVGPRSITITSPCAPGGQPGHCYPQCLCFEPCLRRPRPPGRGVNGGDSAGLTAAGPPVTCPPSAPAARPRPTRGQPG